MTGTTLLSETNIFKFSIQYYHLQGKKYDYTKYKTRCTRNINRTLISTSDYEHAMTEHVV